MVTYATLTVPVVDIIGANFNESRTSVWIEPNVPAVLADGIRVGGRREQVVNGVATFANLVTTNSADNPTSFGYRVTISAPPKGAQKREDIVVLATSDFPFTATANLKDIDEAWDNIALPAEWRSEFAAAMEAVAETAAASATSAAASASAASAISGLTGEDDAVALLVGDTGSATSSALSATFASRDGLGVVMIDTDEDTLTGSDVAPIGSIDGVPYGRHLTSGALYRSTNNGTTWTLVNAVGGYGIHKLGDGEVLINGGSVLKKSSGWATDPSTATFSTVLTANGSSTFIASDVDTFENIAIAGEYAVPRTDARYVKVSTDNGATWTTVRDLNAMHPGQEAETHWHAVCIDGYHGGANPRLWVSHGDGPRGVYYSDNLGASWTEYGTPNTWQPMPMVALPAGVVTSTDQNNPDGIWVIPRDLSPRRLLAQIPAPVWSYSLLGFGIAATRDDATGTAYITFRSEAFSHFTDTLPSYIFATDGIKADLIYETEQRTDLGSNNSLNWEGLPTLTTNGYLMGVYTKGASRYRVRGRVSPGAPGPRSFDTGNALTGQADRASVAAGAGAVALGGSVVLGAGAVQSDDIGTGDYSNVVVGTGADGSNYSVAVGTTAVTGPYGTALGYQAGAAGSDAVAVGRGASAAGNDNIAIGHNASAPAGLNKAVALGSDSVATSWNQVAIGARHIELRTVGGEVSPPTVSGGRLFVRDPGTGYKQLCVQFPGGAVQILASEPA